MQTLRLDRLATPLIFDDVVGSAMGATGLSDLGENDWQEPLGILLEDYHISARLTALGRMVTARLVVGFLSNRLRVVDRRKQASTVATITAPVFILGLPRTGSTLLHELMANHSAFRAPLFWETESLPSNTWLDILRLSKSKVNIGLLLTMAPEFRKIHPLGARRPHECITIQGLSFRSTQFHAIHRLPGYTHWLEQCDWEPAYLWHSRYLRLLQGADQSRRWILKAPGHMQSIDALIKRYPDARFVQLHRQPKETVPSMASLYATLRTTSSEAIDLAEIGQAIVSEWGAALSRVMQARKTPAIDERFMDLHYQDFIKQPFANAERICDFVNAPMLEEDSVHMSRYLKHHLQPRSGKHQYHIDKFGLSEETINDVFSDYIGLYF